MLRKKKERLKKIERPIPEVYQKKIKKWLQPNSCFEEGIKFALDYKEVIYCIGQFQQNEVYNA